ncbi:36221_t:CDS:2, partial [Racocetra persica]
MLSKKSTSFISIALGLIFVAFILSTFASPLRDASILSNHYHSNHYYPSPTQYYPHKPPSHSKSSVDKYDESKDYKEAHSSVHAYHSDNENKMTESLTEEDIKAFLLDIFVAGSDSSSSTLCCIIYYNCLNPRVKQTLFDEIDSVFPNNFSGTLCITTDHLEDSSIVKQRLMKLLYWANPTIFDLDRFYLKIDFDEFNDNFDNEYEIYINDRDKYSLVIFGGGIKT